MQLVQKVEVTRGQHLPIYRCQTASQVSLFVGFLISWISLPMKTTKIGTPQIKVISQNIYLSTNKFLKNSMMVIFYCDRGLTANHLLLIFFMTIYFHYCLTLNIDKYPGPAHLTTSLQNVCPSLHKYLHTCQLI